MTTADPSPVPPVAPSRSPWRHGLHALAVVFGLAMLWTLLVGLWLPNWARPRLEGAATEALGVPVSIAELRVQPWTGVLVLNGMQVGSGPAPLLKLAHAQAQLSLESLWRLAPVLRKLDITGPEVWIERLSAQRFNFSSVLEKLAAQPKTNEAPSEGARFAVFNIALQAGAIHYTDRVLGQTHHVDQLRIGVPFVSNLPSFIDVEVQPLLSARIDGSPLTINGQTLPFSQGRRSAMKLRLLGVDVPHWLAAAQPLVPQAWRMQARDGKLDTDLLLKFEARNPPAVPLLAVEGAVRIDTLALNAPGAPLVGQVDAGWQTLSVQGLDVRPLERSFIASSVQLDGLRWANRPLAVAARQPLKQAVVLQAKAPLARSPAASKVNASPNAGQTTPWSWRVSKLVVNTDRVAVQTEADHPWPAIEALRLRLDGLSNQDQLPAAAWQIEARDAHGAGLVAQGTVQIPRQQLEGQLNVVKVQVKPWLDAFSDAVQWPLRVTQGELNVQTHIQARLKTASALERAEARMLSGHVGLAGWRVLPDRKGLEDKVDLASLTLDGVQAQIDLSTGVALRTVSLDRLVVTGLNAAITRGAQGDWFGMAWPKAGSAPPPGRMSARRPVELKSPPPQLALKDFYCRGCQVRFNDETVTPAGRFEFHDAALHLTGVGSDLGRPIQMDLHAQAQGNGRIQIKGTVQPQPFLLDASVGLVGVDLRAVQPYIDPLVNVTLAGAKAQADGQLSMRLPDKGALQARYKGRLGLSEVRMLDRVNDADLLSWQTLNMDGVDVAWASDALDANLGRITLKDFYGRIIVNPSGKLNVANILRHETGGETKSLTTPESAATPPSASGSAPLAAAAMRPAPKLRWQQIQLGKGRIDFTDNYIKPNYSARLTRIEGEISAVSSTQPEPATVRVAGAVDDAAPLLITGRIHPLGPQLFTDIEGSAKGIELTRLTPYAARYAGYAIEKGTLSVTVHYKVDGGQLQASNQIFLDQLTFGAKTDSPDATKLPVLFAVSLLKNSKGEIDVDLPISGSLDDPEFSVGGIIWRVLANLITKAVTAPFSMLPGGGSDELGLVPFEPGKATLNEGSRQRLDTLAGKLADRPALKLEATGMADPSVDTEGLRQAHVDRLLRVAKAKATGQAPADVQVEPSERSTWLLAAYKAADFKKPSNMLGMTKRLPDAEMEALLKAIAPVGADALRNLANQRADQVKAYLSRKMPPERVLLTASKVASEGVPSDDKGPAAQVRFAIK